MAKSVKYDWTLYLDGQIRLLPLARNQLLVKLKPGRTKNRSKSSKCCNFCSKCAFVSISTLSIIYQVWRRGNKSQKDKSMPFFASFSGNYDPFPTKKNSRSFDASEPNLLAKTKLCDLFTAFYYRSSPPLRRSFKTLIRNSKGINNINHAIRHLLNKK